jgi:hypothetical protein
MMKKAILVSASLLILSLSPAWAQQSAPKAESAESSGASPLKP